MTGPLVAFARKLDAIDLTASLWLALCDETTGSKRPSILWIADPRGNYQTVESDLHALAQALRPEFDIQVASYEESWKRSSFKSPSGLYTFLREELAATALMPCSVRIHHGAFEIRSPDGRATSMRCLEISENSDWFLASPSGRRDSWQYFTSEDIVGISGSLHMYAARDIGEAVNLPWYALGSNIGRFEVRESISPIASYSVSRYVLGRSRLKPLGYSLIDYPFLVPDHVESSATRTGSLDTCYWLMAHYPRTSARIGPTVPGASELVWKLHAQIRRQLVSGNILLARHDGLLTSSISGDIASSLVIICIVARALEAIDRGHGQQVSKNLSELILDFIVPDASRADAISLVIDSYTHTARLAHSIFPVFRNRASLQFDKTRFGELAQACFFAR